MEEYPATRETEDHAHPHRRSDPGDPPAIGIVGAGAVGTALGAALARAGWPIVAVASRDAGRRERFRSLVPGARAFAEATAVLDEAELIILAVPDGAVAGLDEAGALAIYGDLIEQTLGNARALGIANALTGPVTRGDVGTLARHIETLRLHAPAALPLYRAAAEREIVLAEKRGALAQNRAAELRSTLASGD